MDISLKMRPSRVLAKLRAGETAYCIKLNLGDSRVAEIGALSGFDCLWTDMEHVPNDWSTIEKQILAAKIYDVDVIVRVAKGSYSDIIRPLEMDATGIMVPHIMSAEEARQIVTHTKFHPLGRRPADGGNSDAAYCNINFTDYIKQANEQRFNILQIEDPEALDELDEIASLVGVDMLFFGPGDFSQAIGAPGSWDDPRIAQAREKVATAAKKHGKYAGTVGSIQNAKDLRDLGYRFISIGADIIGLNEYFRSLMSGISYAKETSRGIYG